MKRWAGVLLQCSGAAWFLLAPASAAVIATYTDRATWQAASSGVATVDFEGTPLPNIFINLNPTTGLTIQGVNFGQAAQASANTLQLFDTSFLSFYNFGTHAALAIHQIVAAAPTFHITLPAGVTSFGLNLMTASPNGLSYNISAGGGTFTVATNNPPVAAFFGVTFDAPVSTIDLTVPASNFGYAFIDNFSFGAAQQPADPAQTPEACTLVLIGTGLVLFTRLGKRVAPQPAAAGA